MLYCQETNMYTCVSWASVGVTWYIVGKIAIYIFVTSDLDVRSSTTVLSSQCHSQTFISSGPRHTVSSYESCPVIDVRDSAALMEWCRSQHLQCRQSIFALSHLNYQKCASAQTSNPAPSPRPLFLLLPCPASMFGRGSVPSSSIFSVSLLQTVLVHIMPVVVHPHHSWSSFLARGTSHFHHHCLFRIVLFILPQNLLVDE